MYIYAGDFEIETQFKNKKTGDIAEVVVLSNEKVFLFKNNSEEETDMLSSDLYIKLPNLKELEVLKAKEDTILSEICSLKDRLKEVRFKMSTIELEVEALKEVELNNLDKRVYCSNDACYYNDKCEDRCTHHNTDYTLNDCKLRIREDGKSKLNDTVGECPLKCDDCRLKY